MSATRDPETTLAAWLDEGPIELPDATRRAILTALPTSPQTGRGLVPWGRPSWNPYTRLAATAVVAVIAAGGALYLLGPRVPGPGSHPPSPSPSVSPPSPSPGAAASAAVATLPLDTTTWLPYPASRYGYSLAHPSGWGSSPASEDWAGQTSFDMWSSPSNAPWADKTYGSALGLTMTALGATIPDGVSDDAFIDDYLAPPPGPTPTCFGIDRNTTPIVIDGRQARRITGCGDGTDALSAFVVVGDRMFVFSVADANQVELFDAFLSTITLPAELPAAS